MTWSTEYSTPPLHDALPIYVNFDDPCAERRGGDAAVGAAGSLRDADPATVARAQLRHHAEAGALGRAWVLARALHDREVIARRAHARDGGVDLHPRAHAGRQQDGQPGGEHRVEELE